MAIAEAGTYLCKCSIDIRNKSRNFFYPLLTLFFEIFGANRYHHPEDDGNDQQYDENIQHQFILEDKALVTAKIRKKYCPVPQRAQDIWDAKVLQIKKIFLHLHQAISRDTDEVIR